MRKCSILETCICKKWCISPNVGRKLENHIVKARWVDINTGDRTDPNYRCRLVKEEINTYKREDLFAATPPFEALKIVLSMVALNNRGEVLMVNDVSRAFFHAKCKRDVYVCVPDEDRLSGEEGKCAKLAYSLWGAGCRNQLVRGTFPTIGQQWFRTRCCIVLCILLPEQEFANYSPWR